MKLRIITFSVLFPILLSACGKDYFAELSHPLEIRGSFDPVYGIPVAYLSADMGTLVGMLDTSQKITVYVGQDNIISFHYNHYNHTILSWETEAERSKGDSKGDTVQGYFTVTGTEPFDLFQKLQYYDTGLFHINEFYVNLSADIQGYVNDSFEEILAEGANITFDSLIVRINCIDGYQETIPIVDTVDAVDVNDLLEGHTVSILKSRNMRHVVEHRPSSIDYAVRLCVTLPAEQILPGSTFQEQIRNIGVDSIVADIHTQIDIPLNFASSDLTYTDTLDIDLSNIEECLNGIASDTLRGDYYTVSLNDTNCYLYVTVGNGLPLELGLDISFLDQNGASILSTAAETTHTLAPAPVEPLAGHHNTYIATGEVPSHFRIPLSLERLHTLSDTRRICYSVNLNTNNPRPPMGEECYVAIRSDDRVNVRAYIMLSPHADISIPITLPSVPNRN